MIRRRWAIVTPAAAGPTFWRFWTLTGACREAGRRNARLVLNGCAPSWRVVPT